MSTLIYDSYFVLCSSLRIWSPLLRDLESKVLVKTNTLLPKIFLLLDGLLCPPALSKMSLSTAPTPTPQNGIRVQGKLIGRHLLFPTVAILAGTISKRVVPCRLAVCHARKSRWNKSIHGNKATEYTVVIIVNFMLASHSIKQACIFLLSLI